MKKRTKIGTTILTWKFDEKNGKMYEEYKRLSENEKKVIFGGRLGEYKYYDMDKVIESALKKSDELLSI